MSTKEYIGIIAGICSLAGYVPYALCVIRGEVKPERASWFIWTLSSVLIALSYYTLGARTTIWVPLAYVIGATSISILSLIYGREGWGNLEKVTLLVSTLSAIRWILFDNFIFTLAVNLFLSFISYIEYIKRLILFIPIKEKQDAPGWALYFAGALLNIFAINSWTPAISALPLVYFIMNGLTFACLLRYNFHNKKKDLYI